MPQQYKLSGFVVISLWGNNYLPLGWTDFKVCNISLQNPWISFSDHDLQTATCFTPCVVRILYLTPDKALHSQLVSSAMSMLD